jgi:hypothetical protein
MVFWKYGRAHIGKGASKESRKLSGVDAPRVTGLQSTVASIRKITANRHAPAKANLDRLVSIFCEPLLYIEAIRLSSIPNLLYCIITASAVVSF